jgi:pimeloyl-ACP methyl ester carboxylesterase
MLRRAAHRLATGILTALSLTVASAAVLPAQAGALGFTPCADAQSFSCTTLPVPVSRSGVAGGAISLHVERLVSGALPSQSAVIALAGGPGQAANPLAKYLAQAMTPALSGRDLVVFDQRGTGQSNPLGCAALRAPSGPSVGAAQQVLRSCALQLGPARGGYTSIESVQDIEAIREALGYKKLVLYGTSYGTKVALEYAERYPQNVEAMVLDSVVPTGGPNPFALPTFAAITPALDELCSAGACRDISPSPVGAIARLAGRLRRAPLRGSVYDGYGRHHMVALSESEILFILEAGDLNPAVRALLPAAVVAALHGDASPLAQLDALSRGLVPNVPPQRPHGHVEEAVDETLYWTTTCEEEPFPWQRSAPFATRQGEALAALHAIPAHDFFPFEAGVALRAGPLLECLDWPNAAPQPPAAAALPAVPTLILSGGQDLRTPTAQARQVAAQIPGAQFLAVPYTGHSVIGSDLSGCAQAAVQTFFAGLPVGRCPATRDVFGPTPVPPVRLGDVRPTPGLSGNDGRTLTAALDTILDFSRLVIAATLQAEQRLPVGSRIGGLRGGYVELTSSSVHLVHFSFVPGVSLSGTLPLRKGGIGVAPLRVEGRAAAHGVVVIGPAGHASGELGGARFDVRIATAVLSRRQSSGAEARAAAGWTNAWSLRFGTGSAGFVPIPALARLP